MSIKDGVWTVSVCFTAGTPVWTKEGLRPIESVQIGEVVHSWDEKTGSFVEKKVTEQFVHEVPQLFDLELDGEEVIHTTWNHPFWVVGKKAWVKVMDLQVGDLVLLHDGSTVPVTGVHYYNIETTKVYNIEVEDTHAYLVGEHGVVVHNYIVDRTAELLPSKDISGLTTANNDPKFDKFTMDGRTYDKVVDGKGHVTYETRLTNGDKVVLQVTPEGMIKRTTIGHQEPKLWGLYKSTPTPEVDHLAANGAVIPPRMVTLITDRFNDMVKSGTDLAEYTKNGKGAPLDALPERRVKELTDPTNKKLTSIKVDGLAYDRVLADNKVTYERNVNGRKESISITSDGLLRKTVVTSGGETLPEKLLKPNGRDEVTPEGREKIADAGKKGPELSLVGNSKKAAETLSEKSIKELSDPKNTKYDNVKIDGLTYKRTFKDDGSGVVFERTGLNGGKETVTITENGLLRKVGDDGKVTLLRPNGQDPVTPEQLRDIKFEQSKGFEAATRVKGSEKTILDTIPAQEVSSLNNIQDRKTDVVKFNKDTYVKTLIDDGKNGQVVFQKVGSTSESDRLTVTSDGYYEKKGPDGLPQIFKPNGERANTQEVLNARTAKAKGFELSSLADSKTKKLPDTIPSDKVDAFNGSDKKYDTLKLDNKLYTKVADGNNVRFESTGINGEKESVRLTKLGLIERTNANGTKDLLRPNGERVSESERLAIADKNPSAVDVASFAKDFSEPFAAKETAELNNPNSKKNEVIRLGSEAYYKSVDPEGRVSFERTLENGSKEKVAVRSEGLIEKTSLRDVGPFGIFGKTEETIFLKPNGERVSPERRLEIADGNKEAVDIAKFSKKAEEPLSQKDMADLNNPNSDKNSVLRIGKNAYYKAVDENGKVVYERIKANGDKEHLVVRGEGVFELTTPTESGLFGWNKSEKVTYLTPDGSEVSSQRRLALADGNKSALEVSKLTKDSQGPLSGKTVSELNDPANHNTDAIRIGDHAYYKTFDESGKVVFERILDNGSKESLAIRGEGLLELTSQDGKSAYLKPDGVTKVSAEDRERIADNNKSAFDLGKATEKSDLSSNAIEAMRYGSKDPKYDVIKVGEHSYYKTVEKDGSIVYERTNSHGVKERLSMENFGHFEKTVLEPGKDAVVSLITPKGEEISPDYPKMKEAMANEWIRKAKASNIMTDTISKLWSENNSESALRERRLAQNDITSMKIMERQLFNLKQRINEITEASKRPDENGKVLTARERDNLLAEPFKEQSKLIKEVDKLYESTKISYTKLGYESRDKDGRYTGDFAKFNKEPKEFGSSGQDTDLLMRDVSMKAQAVLGFKAGEPWYRAKMKEIHEIVRDLANNRNTSRQSQIPKEEWIKIATRALADISQTPGESREEFMERLNSVEAGAQDRVGGTAIQLTVAIELLQKAYRNGDLKPMIPHDAPDRAQRLENYKKFEEFIRFGWSPELGSSAAAEICRTYANYLQAVDGKVTKASFVEWYTYKGISGDLGFSQGAPVVDLGHTPGYSKSWGMETEGSNDFGGVRLDVNSGELRGIVNPIPLDSLQDKLREFPVGKTIQVYDDTNGNPGANHFCLWLKTDYGWVNYNHTGGASGGAKYKEIIPFNSRTKVYKIYY
ncbi:hypothetical protein EHO59_12850 [Leptospira semungkisensis]|uniref:Hint domain-containing protein n=1 Tax=Leptospira semungkisensis TaxID=2484985 RepID=A0A4R9FR18_9LEPT|nr:polymorphic toxin-type HINT domain-containing protein [Leptospira semungkisensis]TGK00815.1 hypothetical protein EHO59_12850 [Leptospira semungkisensis]